MMVNKKIVLRFPSTLVDQPVICKLAKDFDLEFNILKAYVTPDEEGMLVIELSGKEEDYNKGLKFLKGKGILVQSLRQKIIRNDEKCVHCGACVVICPVGALAMEPETRKVRFVEDSCIACEHCMIACSLQAMETLF